VAGVQSARAVCYSDAEMHSHEAQYGAVGPIEEGRSELRAVSTPPSRFDEVLATSAGPPFTVVVVFFIIWFSQNVVFLHAQDDFSVELKSWGSCFGVLGCIACLACHVTDPGSPDRDPSDPRPVGMAEEHRMRMRRLAGGREWKQKFCKQCDVWRPYRCGHCRYCNRCVLRLDHHCHFVGTCIGERNMRFFAAFILFLGLALICFDVLSVYCILRLGWLSPTLHWFKLLLVADGLIATTVIGVAMVGTALFFVVLMIGDLDMNDFDRELFWEVWRVVTCVGARVYCCAPCAVKAPSAYDKLDPVMAP